MTTPLHSLRIHHLVSAEPIRVFNAFSNADAMSQWFKPSADISVEVITFDFSEGGSYRLRYTMPDESRQVLFGIFQKIVVPEQLIFTWEWEAPDPLAGLPSLVSINFFDRVGATAIDVKHEKIPSKEVSENHARGWRFAFKALECLMEINPIANFTGDTK